MGNVIGYSSGDQASAVAPMTSDSASSRPRRDLIWSFVKTLVRCHSTVLPLMKSRAPIWELVYPSRAMRAISISWAVSSSRVTDRALGDTLAGRDQLSAGAVGERLGTDPAEDLVRETELMPRVDAPVLAAQPFAVQEVSPGEADDDPCGREAFDGLLVQRLGDVAGAEQGARHGLDALSPVGTGGTGHDLESLQAGSSDGGCAAPDGRLDELGQRPGRRGEIGRVVAAVAGCDHGGLVLAGAVVHHCARPFRRAQGEALAPSPSRRRSRPRSASTPRRARPCTTAQHTAAYGEMWVPVASATAFISSTRDAAGTSSPASRCTMLWEHRAVGSTVERAGVTNELDVAARQLRPCLVIPQVGGDPTGQREPADAVLHGRGRRERKAARARCKVGAAAAYPP